MQRLLPLVAIVCSLLSSLNVCAQHYKNVLPGDWVQFKVERKDSSAFISRTSQDRGYLKIRITPWKISYLTHPVKNTGGMDPEFILRDNELIITKENRYVIERLESDTLILVSQFKDETDNISVRRYFVNEKLLIRNRVQSGDTFVADSLNTPSMRRNIASGLWKVITKPPPPFRLDGHLVLDLEKKTAAMKIVDADAADSATVRKLRKVLEKSFDDWELRNFSGFKKVVVPFYFRSVNELTFKGMFLDFVLKESVNFREKFRDEAERIRQADRLYEMAAIAVKIKDFKQAIDYLQKCYEIDPYYLGALYLKADLNHLTGNTAAACADWAILAARKQTEARNLKQMHCP